MTDIDKLLEEARNKAKDYGKLYGRMSTADDKLKGIMAELRDDAPKGSIPEIDAWVRRQDAYTKAVDDKENAYADWKTAEIWMKVLLVEAEVWRSKQANNRFLDKAHQ